MALKCQCQFIDQVTNETGQLTRDIGLSPPPDVVQVVVTSLLLEVVVVGQSVICPPHSAGDPVGQQTVDTVVTPGEQKQHHARHRDHQRGQVEE